MRSLPLDCRIKQLGIPLASRCRLCFDPMESTDHLFVQCLYAEAVWGRMAKLMGFILIQGESPLVRLRRICRIFSKQSVGHGLVRSISLLIYWQLWKERCRRVASEGNALSYSMFYAYAVFLGIKVGT